jgi:uroporphyrinogen decarboxylase
MTSKERVMTALDFRRPDRMPLFDGYWPEWTALWRAAKDLPESADPAEYYGVDVHIAVGEESLAPSRAHVIEQTDRQTVAKDGWGRVIRTIPGGFFYEQLASAVEQRTDLDRLYFDPPDLPARYVDVDRDIESSKRTLCVFAKTGGPFIRSEFVRGELNYLTDLAEDPAFAAELTMRVADHLIGIGLEELRRWDLYDTGIWIYDDMASNRGPIFSPRTAERVLVPAWAKMVGAFTGAGARKVILHSDGNIAPLLDVFVDLGFDGINPVEPRAGMGAAVIRRQYGDRLALIGGICNARILPRADRQEIRAHVEEVLSAGREGGLVIGSHSIGPDISVEAYDWFVECVRAG